MKKINTVILDIGKVLVDFDWMSYIKKLGYTDEVNEQLGKYIFRSNGWRERDRGAKSEEEYIEDFVELAPHLEKEIRRVFENITDIVEEYSYTNEFVKSLKDQGMKVYLLSNYSKKSFEADSQRYTFLPYVDGGVISYEVKFLKPEKEIYQFLLEKYDINPERAVFLDDLEENLEGARAFGIETIHVTSHEKAVEGLQKLGVL